MVGSQVMFNQYFIMYKGPKLLKKLKFHWRESPDPLKTIELPINKWVRVDERDALEMVKRVGKTNPSWGFETREVMPAEDRIDQLEGKFNGKPTVTKDSKPIGVEVNPLGDGDVFEAPEVSESPKSKKQGRKRGSTKKKTVAKKKTQT